jgi:hypothetical protein
MWNITVPITTSGITPTSSWVIWYTWPWNLPSWNLDLPRVTLIPDEVSLAGRSTIICLLLTPNIGLVTLVSLVSPMRTILLLMTHVPTIITTSTHMWALLPSMSLSFADVASSWHRRTIPRVSLLTPLTLSIPWAALPNPAQNDVA